MTPLCSAATGRRESGSLHRDWAAPGRSRPKRRQAAALQNSRMPQRQYNSFSEFWPHYVAEHSKPPTRLLHLLGTTIALGVVVYLFLVGRWWLFPLALIPGYGAAWIGHFFIEKNKPATFQHPLWSFLGDYKMIWLMLTGRMRSEVERRRKTAGASPPSRP